MNHDVYPNLVRWIAAVVLIAAATLLPSWFWYTNRTNIAGWVPDPTAELVEQTDVVLIYVSDPDCQWALELEDIRLGVVERDDAVVITARTPVRRGNCKLSKKAVPVEVTLEEPLGDRALLDGRFDPPAGPRNDFNSGPLPIRN